MRAAIVTGAFSSTSEPVGTTVRHLLDAAVGAGDQVLVIATDPGPSSYRGVPVERLRATDTAAIGRRLSAFAPDVVHLADPRLFGPAPARAVAGLGLPSVVSHHSTGSGPLAARRETWASAGAGRTLVTCVAAVEVARGAGGVGGPPVLWRPGADLDLHGPAMRSDDLVRHWARKGELVVGHVGPVDRPAVRRRLVAIGSLPGVRLVAVRAALGAAGLRKRLPGAKVVGDVSGVDLAHAVASFDVLVQPRKKELDCHGVRRALASGVPVVGMATGGVADLVADGVNGLVGDPGDPAALTAAVARLRDDPDLRARLAGRARDSLGGRTWADAYDELVEVHWASVVPESLPAVRTG